MMPRKDIPGFYYDEEKKKYFRIQQNHRVASAEHVYTKSRVKALRLEERSRERRRSHDRKQRTGKVQRLVGVTDSTSLMQWRLGGKRTTLVVDEVAKLFSRDITARAAFDPICCTAVSRGRCPTYANGTFHVSRNGTLHSLQHIYDSGPVTGPGAIPFTTVAAPQATRYIGAEYAYQQTRATSRDGDLFSVDVSPILWDMCATNAVAEFHAPGIGLTLILQPLLVRGDSVAELRSMAAFSAQNLNFSKVWSVVGHPATSNFALGTDNGLLMLSLSDNPAECLSSAKWTSVPALKGREQMDVSWKDHNIVISGERSGRVNLSDVRTNESVVRLLHSSAVLGTRGLSERSSDQILVHGFSSTSIYDLRFIPRASKPNARSDWKSRRSRPLLDFAIPRDRISNHYSYGRKVAFSAEMDLVVAASSRSETVGSAHHVTLYSARSGKVLDGPLTRRHWPQEVTCIDLHRLRDGPESILTMSDGELLEWTLHNDFDDTMTTMHENDTSGEHGDFDRNLDVVRRGADIDIVEAWQRGTRCMI